MRGELHTRPDVGRWALTRDVRLPVPLCDALPLGISVPRQGVVEGRACDGDLHPNSAGGHANQLVKVDATCTSGCHEGSPGSPCSREEGGNAYQP
jgi:hypothetical protein